jgi:predicted RNA-binding protein YlxR (DUF448 family)/ribosomal protein L7Ae-like RNA K-turn-binding protein
VNAVTETREPKQPKRSARTCAGCGRPDEADAMVRLVRGPEGEIAVDIAGGAFGRGAHVHAQLPCIAKACKGGLARSFKSPVLADAADVARQIVDGCDRRIAGLVGAARRAGVLAVGADASCEALEAGAPLVIVAADAGNVTTRGPIAQAIAEGRAVSWKTKAVLGELLGRAEVSVCVVRDRGISSELAKARSVAGSVTQ